MKKLFFPCFFLLFAITATATVDSLFQVANKFLGQGAYEAAIQRYDSLFAGGNKSVALYYNAGLAHHNAGHNARARLLYERGLLMDPHDEDLKHNLRLLKEELGLDNRELSPFFLKAWYYQFVECFSVTQWYLGGVILLWLGVVVFSISVFVPVFPGRRWAIPLSLIGMVLGFLAFFLGWNRENMITESKKVVVMEQGLRLQSAPDSLSTPLENAGWASVGEIQDEMNDYYKIRMLTGDEGWIKRNRVKKISP